MNASLDTVPSQTRPLQAAQPRVVRDAVSAPDLTVREGILELPGEITLYHGGKLDGVHVAWRMVGPANAPVVCALGGISANRRVCVTEDPRQSWWAQIVGPGCPVDVNRFRILSFDFLGGSGDTTGPK